MSLHLQGLCNLHHFLRASLWEQKAHQEGRREGERSLRWQPRASMKQGCSLAEGEGAFQMRRVGAVARELTQPQGSPVRGAAWRCGLGLGRTKRYVSPPGSFEKEVSNAT